MSGTPNTFRSRAEFDRLVEELVAVGAISDASKIYWDVRPSSRYETIEYRVADVCMTVDEAILHAGLCRALAMTCAREVERDEPEPEIRPELLRAAKWRAARFGLDESLVDARAREELPAWQLVERLLDHLRPILEENGEWDEIADLARAVLMNGNGASRQRVAYVRAERLEDVVDLVVAETVESATSR
jgi:carboxylate-amine ligase